MVKKILYFENENDRFEIDLELKKNDSNDYVFSASGSMFNKDRENEDDYDNGCYGAGQCINNILEEMKDTNSYNQIKEINDLWEEYHLNDMKPYCEHQKDLGWDKIAKEEVIIKEWRLEDEIFTIRSEILNLEDRVKTYNNELVDIDLYYLINTSTEIRQWIRYEDSKVGLLCRPCPVCGFEYGTEWKVNIIPDKDIERIKQIMGD